MGDGSRIGRNLKAVRASAVDVAMLCHHLRQDEREQWMALTGAAHYNPEEAAQAVISSSMANAWALVNESGRAVVVGGLDVDRPGVASAWMLGTDAGWASYWYAITRHARRFLHCAIAAGAVHRIEIVALSSREAACAWYQHGLGMVFEGRRPGYFANGASASVFTALSPEVLP